VPEFDPKFENYLKELEYETVGFEQFSEWYRLDDMGSITRGGTNMFRHQI
jgi:hypothetical protein